MGHAHAGHDLVVEVRLKGVVAGHQHDHVDHVGGVEPAGGGGHLAGYVGTTPQEHAAGVGCARNLCDVARGCAFDVSARFGGKIDDDRPGLHRRDHVGGD